MKFVKCRKNYKNASQDIRNQLDAEAEAEAVQIILTGIDNDIYPTVDACPNACKMWKAIEKLKQGESINIQDLETNLYWKFGKFTSRDGESLKSYYSRFYKMMNELSQELKTVSYHKLYDILKQHQNKVNELRAERLAHTVNNHLHLSQQAATRNRGKAIFNSPPPTYDQEPTMVAGDDEMSKEKEIDKLMALISLSFKKIYKPTNNNLRTSSNTSTAGVDVRSVWNSRDDTDDEPDEQELEAHYLYMAQIQEVTPDAADKLGPTKMLKRAKGQGGTNITIKSLDMSTNRETVDQDDDLPNERDLLASLIEKLKCEIDDNKNRKNLESSNTSDEMVADLRYFNSLEHEVDSLKSQLETQKIQFLNEIDRLSREYYNADHMNAILCVYTTLDEFTDLQCDYVDQVVEYERLEKELSKSNITSKRFEALQQHAIDIELALQQCQEQIENDKSFKENQSKVFLKEREQYFEIQDLKTQLQDTGIAISELKKLIDKIKGKSVETKFEKSSVIQQPNAFKCQRQSILGNASRTANILEHKTPRCSTVSNTPLSSNSFVTRTVKFGNDQIAPILGYGDRIQGTITIKRGNDLLTDIPRVLIDFLILVQRGLHAQVTIVRTDKGTEFLNKTLHADFSKEGIRHETSTARTLEQNGVVERRNRTLVEAA
ncbi:retrovirus-related pol polyprotein from transposon TNT 1-94 [Tanacetum coccineum]